MQTSIQYAYENVRIFIKDAKDDFYTEVIAVAIPEVDVQRVGKIAEELGAKFRIRESVYHASSEVRYNKDLHASSGKICEPDSIPSMRILGASMPL